MAPTNAQVLPGPFAQTLRGAGEIRFDLFGGHAARYLGDILFSGVGVIQLVRCR